MMVGCARAARSLYATPLAYKFYEQRGIERKTHAHIRCSTSNDSFSFDSTAILAISMALLSKN